MIVYENSQKRNVKYFIGDQKVIDFPFQGRKILDSCRFLPAPERRSKLPSHGDAMDDIEEKSPRGITFKVLTKKWNFLVFDQKGASIYSDDAGLKVLHRVRLVAFVGGNFQVKNTASQELSFLKVIKNKVVIPYVDLADSARKYIFIDADGRLDMLPVRLKALGTIAQLVREIDSGTNPDYIVVDKNITKNDIIIIKNRLADAHIILAGAEKPEAEPGGEAHGIDDSTAERRATDVLKEVNINMMSNNPVFLARVHLREMNLSKMNQLILDFDLTAHDAEYIKSFVTTMLGKADADQEIRKNKQRLETIRDSLQFFIHLTNKDDAQIRQMIASLHDNSMLASYSTLMAKAKLLHPGTDDQLLFTDYENLLWEKKHT